MTWLNKGLRRRPAGSRIDTWQSPFDMTWLDKGLRQDAQSAVGILQGRFPFDMTWLDKGLRLTFRDVPTMGTSFDMTWLDKRLRLWIFSCISYRFLTRFDMTWLDKGLRPLTEQAPCLVPHGVRLIWPDLIRDYDGFSSISFHFAAALFDMTWLDKGLRHSFFAWWYRPSWCLIWPDLIRD